MRAKTSLTITAYNTAYTIDNSSAFKINGLNMVFMRVYGKSNAQISSAMNAPLIKIASVKCVSTLIGWVSLASVSYARTSLTTSGSDTLVGQSVSSTINANTNMDFIGIFTTY